MHIPDGYLSPSTCAVMYAAAAPFWLVAVRKLRATVSERAVPMLALLSAFSFVVMMFAVPLFGGTTGHPVGATLIAVTLGPWAAVLGESITLIIQAVFFGDGGITAIGANCFNMAVVIPFVSWAVYRLLAPAGSSQRRRVWAGAAAGYAGLNVSALVTAVEFGVQPLLFRAPDGRPLYCPYPLSLAVPGMVLGHLLIAGPAEAFTTAAAIKFLMANHPELVPDAPSPQRTRSAWKLWLALGLLIAATPLGLLVSGTAWGEWGRDELRQALGFVPQGLSHLSELWNAPIPDYEIPRLGARLGYALSGLVGVLIVVAAAVLLGKVLVRQPQRPQTDRSLDAVLSAMHDGVASERLALRPGFLQSLDPRVKVFGMLCMVAAAVSAREPATPLIVLLTAMLAGWASGAPPLRLFSRTVLVAVLFTAAFALPALFSVVTPGDAVVTIARLRPDTHGRSSPLPAEIAITRQGVTTALMLLARATACVSWAWLAASTTRADLLFRSMRSLGLPGPVVETLAMTHRYLVVLLRTAADMLLARRSRSAGKLKTSAHRGVLGAVVGSLLAKASHLGYQVYLARVSRGYSGAGAAARLPRLNTRDALWLCAALVSAALLILADRRFWW
ncbi:MAG: cobalt transporter CbiM [Armatimonadota bacterium]